VSSLAWGVYHVPVQAGTESGAGDGSLVSVSIKICAMLPLESYQMRTWLAPRKCHAPPGPCRQTS
jgi:hypothetical protein